MAYICGFDGEKKYLRLHMEAQWKIKRDQMKRNGCHDVIEWAKAGQQVIDMVVNNDGGSKFYNVDSSDLRLVCHFRSIDQVETQDV